MQPNLEELCINSIRFLAIDAVEGRIWSPRTTDGRGSDGFVLWDRFLRFNPKHPG